jgi:O-antigen/teichoic acid export membrane protein
MALAPEAMRILAPREYLDAYPALLPIVLTTPLSLLSSVNSICLVNEGRAKETLMISVGGTAVGLILNFMLIGKIGYLGAGVSMLASQTTTALSGLFVIFRSRLGRVIDLKKITEAVLTALTIGAVAYFLFESPALRVLLLIPPTIALLNVFFGFHRLFIE